jgi:hypothetical protein
VVNGVATDAADATAQWVSRDGKIKITGCGNTVSGNNLTAANKTVTTGLGFNRKTTVTSNNITVVGSNNTVRASPTRHHPHNTHARALLLPRTHAATDGGADAPRRDRLCASVAWCRR